MASTYISGLFTRARTRVKRINLSRNATTHRKTRTYGMRTERTHDMYIICRLIAQFGNADRVVRAPSERMKE